MKKLLYELGKIFVRDAIKFDFLSDILAEKIKISFALNDSEPEDYINSIRSSESRVKVYGNFSISEDPDGRVLTVRVAAVNSSLRISLVIPENLSGKNISLYRNSSKSVEKNFEISSLNKEIEIIKIDSQSYSVKIDSKPASPEKLQGDIQEFNSRVKINENILKYYDEDIAQEIQGILSDVKAKLSQAEEKIKILITAREDEIKRIESAVK